MKGKLIKIEERWMVGTVCYADLWSNYIPLHPDDVNLMPFRGQLMNDQHIMDGKEVEFEIVPYDGVSKISEGWGGYAKLIPSKEQQKQLITEIMDLDAKDGLYENSVWEAGLEDELNKLPYTKHLDDGQYNDGQLVGFELGATWGYNKAKETLYTEKQVIGFAEWISGKYSYGNILGKWYLHENTNKSYTEKELFDLYIQSLKQPKNN